MIPHLKAVRMPSNNIAKQQRKRRGLVKFQINIGLKCNLARKHCHVESSPARTEEMSRETLEQCLAVFCDRGLKTIDITGGAPEMNPNYEWFLREAVGAGASVMTRSNLSICKEPGYEHIPELWAELGITVIASLPHYVKCPRIY